MPEINTDLFEKIHTQLTFHPESHNQDQWEDNYAECGTTRCVAGWAIFLHHENESTTIWHVVPRDYHDSIGPNVAPYARDLLGLTDQQAVELFFANDDQYAADMVNAYRHKDPQERYRLLADAHRDVDRRSAL